jgi:hypothetical protein
MVKAITTIFRRAIGLQHKLSQLGFASNFDISKIGWNLISRAT